MTGFWRVGVAVVLLSAACSTYHVVPKRLQGQVRKDVQFTQVEQAPDSHKGQTVVWAGKILDIGRLRPKYNRRNPPSSGRSDPASDRRPHGIERAVPGH
jgi:hypothetical protein